MLSCQTSSTHLQLGSFECCSTETAKLFHLTTLLPSQTQVSQEGWKARKQEELYLFQLDLSTCHVGDLSPTLHPHHVGQSMQESWRASAESSQRSHQIFKHPLGHRWAQDAVSFLKNLWIFGEASSNRSWPRFSQKDLFHGRTRNLVDLRNLSLRTERSFCDSLSPGPATQVGWAGTETTLRRNKNTSQSRSQSRSEADIEPFGHQKHTQNSVLCPSSVTRSIRLSFLADMQLYSSSTRSIP